MNWSDLPDVLLSPVANKLIQTVDFIRFGAVCSSWRSVYVETKERLSKKSHLQLMLLCNLSPNNRFHTFQVPIPSSNYVCRGSSHGGWLVTESKEDNKIRLFNPFLSFNNDMLFPRLDHDFFFKADVNPTNRVVVAIVGYPGYPQRLFFIRPGDKKWTLIPEVMYAHDVIYHQEDDRFYVTRENLRVFVIHVNGPSAHVEEIKKKEAYICFAKQYIVKSPDGNALLVSRITKQVRGSQPVLYVTCNFKVFKVDPTTPRLCPIQTLGEHVLFLGDNSSLLLPATQVPACMSDCIYFTVDTYYQHIFKQDLSTHRDTGVFNLKDGSISPLPLMDFEQTEHVPIPIQPML